MSLNLKRLTSVMLVVIAMAARQAAAFSMLGPLESWQTSTRNFQSRWFFQGGNGGILRLESDTLTFQVTSLGGNPGFSGTVEIGGSKNLGDEYRLNTPIITYAYDSSFLDYFGTNGVKAIDGAFSIINKLPRVSSASKDLSEFLTDNNQRINQRAQALNLVDLKSTTLSLLLERMGLIGEEHVFDIHERIATPAQCVFGYITVVRNFDPITWEPSHYVNGTLYTYNIIDLCPADAVADAVEQTVDNAGILYTAAATQEALQYGGYYLGITRDDMGGLRYLYRHDNYNNEALPNNSVSRGAVSTFSPVVINGTNLISTNTIGLRSGIEKVTFQKVAYSSVLGTSFKPMQLHYTLQLVTNYAIRAETITRTITQPDIIFKAEDLTGGGFYPSARRDGGGFVTVATVGTNGPGIFSPQANIIFNKMGPALLNSTPFFLNEVTASQGFLWGSFDGSTNDPIVFPNGTSIRDLELQVLASPLTPAPGTTFNPGGF